MLFQNTIQSFRHASSDGRMGSRWYVIELYLRLVGLIDSSGIALVFDPDRFLDDRVKNYLVRNPFMFLPFNAGPRLCLGQQVKPFTLFSFSSLTFLLIIPSSRTMKCPSCSFVSSKTSLPSLLRPMLNLLILVPQRIGRKIREGRGRRKLGRETI